MKQTAGWMLRKCVRMLVLLLLVSAASFFLVSLSPVDPLQSNVGQAALGAMSQEQVEELKEYWGVGTPALERFISWLSGVLSGDLGTSLLYRRPVAQVVGERFLSSLWLMASAWVLSGVFGLILGILAGAFKGKWPDRLITGYCMVTASTPSFWIGLVLLLIFSVHLGLFPIGLGVPIGMEAGQVTIADRISHAFLPVLTLSLTGISSIALHTRAKMADIMESPYVLYARARGERDADRGKTRSQKCASAGHYPAVCLHQRDFRRFCAGGAGVFLSGAGPGRRDGWPWKRRASASGNYPEQRCFRVCRKSDGGSFIPGGGSENGRFPG